MDNATHDMSEKLMQYLDGELPAADKVQLEQQLASDAALREELENLQLAREAVRSYGLKSRVAGIHAAMMEEMQPPVRRLSDNRRIFRFSMAVAASVLVVVLAARLLINSPLSGEKIYNEHFYSYELSTTRGESNSSLVEEAYRSRDFNRVISLADTAHDVKSRFLAGMAQLETSHPEKAIAHFRAVLQWDEANSSTDYMDASEFYMALAFIAGKQYTFAAGLLEKIRNNPYHTYHERVTEKWIEDVKKLK